MFDKTPQRATAFAVPRHRSNRKETAMRIRRLALLAVLSGALVFGSRASYADTLRFTNGTEVEGVIKKVECGKVFVVLGEEERVFDILDIESMDFNTPHMQPIRANVPLDHFLKSIEAQEMVRNIE